MKPAEVVGFARSRRSTGARPLRPNQMLGFTDGAVSQGSRPTATTHLQSPSMDDYMPLHSEAWRLQQDMTASSLVESR